MKGKLYLILVIIVLGCQSIPHQKDWVLVYKNNAFGEALEGNKMELVNAVRNGSPVRVGFGGRLRSDSTLTIEHIFETQFITILNDNEVYAQMEPIIGQNPLIEKDTTNILFRHTQWNIIVGTNGFSDRITMTLNRDSVTSQNQKNMSASWFVKKGVENDKKPIPLWVR
ncbi:hypothetical protein [uncultured Croceitalea sp.]|uniref:hypothetical protein n=1 Tax=uncultured Croceitalea sp. TaxID=1798908 RepID=UPI0033056AB1